MVVRIELGLRLTSDFNKKDYVYIYIYIYIYILHTHTYIYTLLLLFKRLSLFGSSFFLFKNAPILLCLSRNKTK